MFCNRNHERYDLPHHKEAKHESVEEIQRAQQEVPKAPVEKDDEMTDAPAAVSAVVDAANAAHGTYELRDSPSKAAVDNQLHIMADDPNEKN